MSDLNLENILKADSATLGEIASIQSRLETQVPAFVSKENVLAVLAFGGTIQSAYLPEQETIQPIPMNYPLHRSLELGKYFGIAEREITGAILVAKDSRFVTNADVLMLLHTIEHVENRRILITCGTYKLPVIARAVEARFGKGKSNKIIGITGSMLPASQHCSDADYNIGGTLAALNAFEALAQSGLVFAQFHGRIVTGEALAQLNLHPDGYQPRFGFPTMTPKP